MSINIQFYRKLVGYLCAYIIFITPYQLQSVNIDSEIFPSLDLIVIFVIMVHNRIGYLTLFILGLFIDYLNTSSFGMYSFILITAELLIRSFIQRMESITYLLKILLFISFYSFITVIKYLTFSIVDLVDLPIGALLMQYFTTILSYPIVYLVLEKIMNLRKVA